MTNASEQQPCGGPRKASAAGPAPVALVGPTASGKSGVALAVAAALAPQLPVEIVSVDSAQVYRGMDIGTAKPSLAERAAVPHHGIDLIEPCDSWSAAQFAGLARQLIGAIRARGALPLLVGGTMLYLKALREGLNAMPASDPVVRAMLDARAAVEGWPALHAQLQQVDPVTAARLKPRDAQRIQRALEVWHQTGRPLSSFHANDAAGVGAPDGPQAGPCAVRMPVISLEPESRDWLHRRIARRFDAMLDAGFVDEVTRLRRRGDLNAQMPSMRCVGYRQAWEALEHGTLAGLREAGVAATRQLAKRQLTWLRGMPERQVVAADAEDGDTQCVAQAVTARVREHLDSPG